MRKVLMTLLLATTGLGAALADDVADELLSYRYVAVWTNGGTSVTVYDCADHPVMVPQGDHLSLYVNGTEVQFPAGTPFKFTFSQTKDVDTGVEEVQKEGVVDISQKEVSLGDLPDDVKSATLYALDGRKMMQAKVKDGEVKMDIARLKGGIYLVTCGKLNFKFLKK